MTKTPFQVRYQRWRFVVENEQDSWCQRGQFVIRYTIHRWSSSSSNKHWPEAHTIEQLVRLFYEYKNKKQQLWYLYTRCTVVAQRARNREEGGGCLPNKYWRLRDRYILLEAHWRDLCTTTTAVVYHEQWHHGLSYGNRSEKHVFLQQEARWILQTQNKFIEDSNALRKAPEQMCHWLCCGTHENNLYCCSIRRQTDRAATKSTFSSKTHHNTCQHQSQVYLKSGTGCHLLA